MNTRTTGGKTTGSHRSSTSQLRAAVPLALDREVEPGNSPLQPDRFQITCYIDAPFAWLTDQFTLNCHLLPLDHLMDPDFDVVRWLHLRKSEMYNQLLFDKWTASTNNEDEDSAIDSSVPEPTYASKPDLGDLVTTSNRATPLERTTNCVNQTFGALWCGALNPNTTERTAGRVKGRDRIIPKPMDSHVVLCSTPDLSRTSSRPPSSTNFVCTQTCLRPLSTCSLPSPARAAKSSPRPQFVSTTRISTRTAHLTLSISTRMT